MLGGGGGEHLHSSRAPRPCGAAAGDATRFSGPGGSGLPHPPGCAALCAPPPYPYLEAAEGQQLDAAAEVQLRSRRGQARSCGRGRCAGLIQRIPLQRVCSVRVVGHARVEGHGHRQQGGAGPKHALRARHEVCFVYMCAWQGPGVMGRVEERAKPRLQRLLGPPVLCNLSPQHTPRSRPPPLGGPPPAARPPGGVSP